MFDVLDVEDDAKRGDRDNRGPKAEVASPYVFVVFNLQCCLDCSSDNKCSEGDLKWRKLLDDVHISFRFIHRSVAYQLRVEVPIALHWLWRAVPVQIPQRANSSYDSKRRHDGYPDIEEAWREVIANRAYWAPSFAITA